MTILIAPLTHAARSDGILQSRARAPPTQERSPLEKRSWQATFGLDTVKGGVFRESVCGSTRHLRLQHLTSNYRLEPPRPRGKGGPTIRRPNATSARTSCPFFLVEYRNACFVPCARTLALASAPRSLPTRRVSSENSAPSLFLIGEIWPWRLPRCAGCYSRPETAVPGAEPLSLTASVDSGVLWSSTSDLQSGPRPAILSALGPCFDTVASSRDRTSGLRPSSDPEPWPPDQEASADSDSQ